MVAGTWNRIGPDLVSKLTEVGDSLDSWGREKYEDVARKVYDLKHILQTL